MFILYILSLISLTIYSYALIDPNLTLISHPLFEQFRNMMVVLGYHNRPTSFSIYLILIGLLSVCHDYFVRKEKKIQPLKLAIVIGSILLFSYPFLSHDFFNYLFDAKIVTFYHQNPYIHKALDFPTDHWLRFMHWTHRTYPYGPTWLLVSLVPSFLAFGKFFLNFFFFKALFVGLYIGSVYFLSKMDKKAAMFFATSPLVLIEGLVSSHNDLVAVFFAFAGIYYLDKKKNIIARVLLLFSGGVKYFTLPLVALMKDQKKWNTIVVLGVLALIGYVSTTGEIQPWYFLNVLVLLPYYKKWVYAMSPFFLGLLLSYYPYIQLGGWDSPEKVVLKHNIILISGVISLAFLALQKKRITES